MQSKHLIVLAILSAYLLINLGIGIYILDSRESTLV